MPVDRINDIMTNNQSWAEVGLGESGESYIVGADRTLRNQSRFLLEDSASYLSMMEGLGYETSTIDAMRNLGSSIGLQRVETAGTEAALAGDSGTLIFPDYRNVPVLSSYRPLNILDLQWAILSEIDEAEAFRFITAARNRMILGFGIIIVIVIIVAFGFARSLTRPIEALSASAAGLAAGKLDISIDTSGHDEIGDLARSFARMQESLRELVQRQTDAIDALSTPLIPLHEEVMIMPSWENLMSAASPGCGRRWSTAFIARRRGSPSSTSPACLRWTRRSLRVLCGPLGRRVCSGPRSSLQACSLPLRGRWWIWISTSPTFARSDRCNGVSKWPWPNWNRHDDGFTASSIRRIMNEHVNRDGRQLI
jgi:HAMP domain-containing protein